VDWPAAIEVSNIPVAKMRDKRRRELDSRRIDIAFSQEFFATGSAKIIWFVTNGPPAQKTLQGKIRERSNHDNNESFLGTSGIQQLL
jgi:hypothetical protein